MDDLVGDPVGEAARVLPGDVAEHQVVVPHQALGERPPLGSDELDRVARREAAGAGDDAGGVSVIVEVLA